MSTIAATTIEDRASGDNTAMLDAVYGTARAWVNFDGTGTVSIRDDYNVDSIVDDGTGRYTINFTNALPDTNYVPVAMGGTGVGEDTRLQGSLGTTEINEILFSGGGSGEDVDLAMVAVFGNPS